MRGMSDATSRRMTAPDVLIERLRDARGRRVVFLSHCLLDENTRYLGGACRAGCVREVVDEYLDQGLGIVQMPCPEAIVWGGVLKRRMLRFYGARWGPILLPFALVHVRRAYRRLARAIARQIEDYASSGCEVVAVVGIDGSPTCGVHRTIDIAGFVRDVSRVDPAQLTVAAHNELVRGHVVAGRGLFITALAAALRRRVPLLAHDLIAELDGAPAATGTPARARSARRGRPRRGSSACRGG